MGGPVDDIYAALSAIRQVLPEHDKQTHLGEWVPRAQKSFAAAQKWFRLENGDEAGWGAATFSELSSLLMGLTDVSQNSNPKLSARISLYISTMPVESGIHFDGFVKSPISA